MPVPGLTAGLITSWAMLLASTSPVEAAVPWHADLPAALSASASSGKPVLVVFTASWDDAAQAGVLTDAEVEAVVAACFEAVRLDVDEHADEARELGVQHVPAACVMGTDRQRLTTFECTASPTEFVAAAARAAQLAVAADPRAPAADLRPGTSTAFRTVSKRSADGSNATVSNKVRDLSNFAEGDTSPRRSSSPASPTGLADIAVRDAAADPAHQSPQPTPVLARTPPAWPAEQVDSPAAGLIPGQAAGTDQAIMPQSAPTAPWLAAASAAPASPATERPAAVPETAPSEPVKPEPKGFLAALQKPWSIFSAKPATQPVTDQPAQPPKMPPALPQWRGTAAAAASTVEADTLGPMPLGLEGYCPVTVLERGSWVEGRPQWGVRHRGRTYLFAGPEQQRAFLADPDRYAPALSGDDPVLVFEGGRSQPGRRAFGVTYQSRMYLFSSPETRAAFTADPDRYTSRVLIAEGLPPAAGTRRF